MEGNRKLLLSDPQRQKLRDDKLWIREEARARGREPQKLHCPCTDCRGRKRAVYTESARKHLRKHERAPECRVWRGLETNSADEEWEEAWLSSFSRNPYPNTNFTTDGIDVQRAVGDMFRNAENAVQMETEVDNITMAALEESDHIMQQPYMEGEHEDNRVHGEETNPLERPDDLQGNGPREKNNEDTTGMGAAGEGIRGDEHLEDARVLEESMRYLHSGTTLTQLSACVMLMNIKATHSTMTDKLADDVIATVKAMLPADNCLPGSIYDMRRITERLGLTFSNIHGCINGCVLFDLDETKNRDTCPTCSHPRYADMQRKSRPFKVLRHFHLIPRLRRMYRTPALAKLMRWHHENLSTDGKVRFPADSQAWKRLDTIPANEFNTNGFGQNPQDVRLKVSVDGVCPFKLHRSVWSAWPVLISFLNLPPWLITKRFFTMLSLIIPGKKQPPFQYFHLWMRPLLDELKILWNGIPAYDASEVEGRKHFNLRAAVLYSTHDFPGYGIVAGVSHQGGAACPPCGRQLKGRYSKILKKSIYTDARRWLSDDHVFRSSAMDKFFDNKSEQRSRPVTITTVEQREALDKYRFYQQEMQRRQAAKRVRTTEGTDETTDPNDDLEDPSKVDGIKRESVFTALPYWEYLDIRYTLDLMHCERNLAANIVHTICGVPGKDEVSVRRDMETEGIRPHLWMRNHPTKPQKYVKPASNYTLTSGEFDTFCTRLESLKVPSGYSSEIGKHVRERKFGALKSHDYHVIMQTLLPLALEGLMDKTTRLAIMRTCRLFRRLCCRVWDPEMGTKLQEDAAETLSLMQIVFPPSFFVVMSHLPLHLVDELIILGPNHVRWMYPVERAMEA